PLGSLRKPWALRSQARTAGYSGIWRALLSKSWLSNSSCTSPRLANSPRKSSSSGRSLSPTVSPYPRTSTPVPAHYYSRILSSPWQPRSAAPVRREGVGDAHAHRRHLPDDLGINSVVESPDAATRQWMRQQQELTVLQLTPAASITVP